ncbi:hypothetical protein T265_11902 [Opisthorchis viverrini]|uniref:Uncharacterized protein n=1 Tax=Opisthorchis viverrini TaxID=6198 RepID=A0A074Z1B2_OPIVI|nr:hypothetical protein T265_11902 [Opisthorchis viverrini]KER19267.1 hypothetical protein T265_11902 [Opisthorchis viverrini]
MGIGLDSKDGDASECTQYYLVTRSGSIPSTGSSKKFFGGEFEQRQSQTKNEVHALQTRGGIEKTVKKRIAPLKMYFIMIRLMPLHPALYRPHDTAVTFPVAREHHKQEIQLSSRGTATPVAMVYVTEKWGIGELIAGYCKRLPHQ